MPAHRADRELNVAFVTEFPDLLEESSALAIADEVVWTLNDSGNTAVLFTLSRKVRFWLKSPLAMRAMSIGSRWLRTKPIFLWRTPGII